MHRVLTLCLFVIFSTLLFSQGTADVLNVYPDGSGLYLHIQSAIDSSSAGDTIVAMAGTYMGEGNHDIDFRGKAIVLMAQSSYDTTVADSSIIDCQGLYRGFFFHGGEDSSSVLRGFVIQRGNTWEYPSDPDLSGMGGPGAGIYCRSSSPTIRNNVIRQCRAFLGGGIACLDSSPRIEGNRIESCYVTGNGGGILCSGGAPLITDNDLFLNDCSMGFGAAISCLACDGAIIARNTMRDNYGAAFMSRETRNVPLSREEKAGPSRISPMYTGGGGLYLDNSAATIEANVISRNGGGLWAESSRLRIVGNEFRANHGDGGAILCNNCECTIDSNLVHYNATGGMERGGGMLLTGSLLSRIRHNTIDHNDADGFGGGIAYEGDERTVIADNVITNNIGSGINCASSITIENNFIASNLGWRQENFSGGITINAGSPLLRNNVIVGNAGFWGGGVYCGSGAPRIENNTISANRASFGSGIYCGEGSTAVIAANVVANSGIYDGSYAGGGIYSESPAVTISCCDVYDNAGGNYVGIPDQTGSNGNFSLEPIFCDAPNGDYSIHELSPCAPGNHPAEADCGLIGARGIGCYYIATLLKSYRANIRPGAIVVIWELSKSGDDSRFVVLRSEVSVGEYREIETVRIAGSGMSYSFRDDSCEPRTAYRYRVDVVERAERRMLFETDVITAPALPLALSQNHPNPFNPSTTIGYCLPEKTRVRLEIFDISGRRVATLVDGERERGERSIVWNGADGRGAPVASGVYFSRLTAGTESLSRKMILLR